MRRKQPSHVRTRAGAAKAPDARRHHNPEPVHVRALVAATGLTYAQLAARLGCGVRTLERWLGEGGMPYTAQYAIEALAAQGAKERTKYRKPVVQEPPPRPAPAPAPPEPPKPRPHPMAALLKGGTPNA